jgi:peptidyl-prolyl cis-trans isomerase SurA
MKPGEVSDVIRTKQGFVILKVTEHQQAGVPPLSQIEGGFRTHLHAETAARAARYLQKLREEAYIKIAGGTWTPAPAPTRRTDRNHRQGAAPKN